MIRSSSLVLVLFQSSLVLGSITAFASEGPLDPAFYANRGFQTEFPGASVLHANSFQFIEEVAEHTLKSGDDLVAAIRNEPGLAQAVLEFPQLPPSARIQVMKQVFALEVLSSGVKGPELVLDNLARKSTFFEFDPKKAGPGRVILNPAKLFADSNPYAALLFLIHETRHSYQFQLGFSAQSVGSETLSQAYQVGFSAQRSVFDHGRKISFCDFLTLNQEYEAFLFGNYVMKKLTDGAVETSDMGTLASQYILGQGLRLDLVRLARATSAENLLDAFNELEKIQYREMHRSMFRETGRPKD